MNNDPSQYLTSIFSVPMGDMIASVGEGVAQAQSALDAGSMQATLELYDDQQEGVLKALREIGYQPNFYGVRNVSGKLKVACSMVAETTGLKLYTSPSNPTQKNKYGFSGSSSAEISFEIVPLPPTEQIRKIPDIFENPNNSNTPYTPEEAEKLLISIGLDVEFIDTAGQEVEDTAGMTLSRIINYSTGQIVKIDTTLQIELS